jgi:hypothetical protein
MMALQMSDLIGCAVDDSSMGRAYFKDGRVVEYGYVRDIQDLYSRVNRDLTGGPSDG